MLAARVGDYVEQVMAVQVPYGPYWMCEISKDVPLVHSTFCPLTSSTDQHIYLELLDETNINTLYTLGVHPIYNKFRQYPLWKVY